MVEYEKELHARIAGLENNITSIQQELQKEIEV